MKQLITFCFIFFLAFNSFGQSKRLSIYGNTKTDSIRTSQFINPNNSGALMLEKGQVSSTTVPGQLLIGRDNNSPYWSPDIPFSLYKFSGTYTGNTTAITITETVNNDLNLTLTAPNNLGNFATSSNSSNIYQVELSVRVKKFSTGVTNEIIYFSLTKENAPFFNVASTDPTAGNSVFFLGTTVQAKKINGYPDANTTISVKGIDFFAPTATNSNLYLHVYPIKDSTSPNDETFDGTIMIRRIY